MMVETPILFEEKEECCGCAACETVCPKGCINMKRDGQGFLYPEINSEKCIKCFMCVKVCPLKQV